MKANAPRRQIRLPWRKAVELSWKSIRLRPGRSALVTSSIVLALAFLCSVLTTQTLLDGMRRWIAEWPASDEASAVHARRDRADADLAAVTSVLRFEADRARPAADAKPFDPETAFGRDWNDLRAEAGALPLPASDLAKLLRADPGKAGEVERALELSKRRKALRAELNRPQDLEATLIGHGVPTAAQDVAAARTQTRWVIGSATLVAFVGILNAVLMSVTERFREIGTMKCLGALDGFIVKLFLLESLLQGMVGTTLGVIVGLGVAFGAAATTYGGAAWRAASWAGVAQGVGITLGVGLLLSVGGAIVPALKAARMEPIAAMRADA